MPADLDGWARPGSCPDLAIPDPGLGFGVPNADFGGPEQAGHELRALSVEAPEVIRPVKPVGEQVNRHPGCCQWVGMQSPKALLECLAPTAAVEVEGEVAVARVDVEALNGFPDCREQGPDSSLGWELVTDHCWCFVHARV